jgi:hypothetical protein
MTVATGMFSYHRYVDVDPWLRVLVRVVNDGYRINWHIVPPYVARAAEMRALGGGTIQKGVLYAQYGPMLNHH